MTKRFLFVTRKYPPIVGGMENLSYDITTKTSKKRKSIIIANRKGNKNLLFFMISSFFTSIYKVMTNKIDIVHLGDPVMSPIGLILKYIFRKKVFVEIHGLDVTFQNWFYQVFFVKLMLLRFDGFICISEMAKNEIIKRGAKEERCSIIPIGIDNKHLLTNKKKKNSLDELSNITKISLEGKEILITVGRLVKRKGVDWFVNNVMSHIRKDRIYLVIGDGEDRELIEKSVKEKGLTKRVFLLGRVSDKLLKAAYNSADLFIMPNITVRNDMEGFGIVAIEASSLGIPVIATGIEGIRDAILDEKNGILLKEKDAKGFTDIINSLPKKSEKYKKLSTKCRKYTTENYNWDGIIDRYIKFMEK